MVRTTDTDIFMNLLLHAENINLEIYLDTGTGKHRQLVNVSELATSLGQPYCSTLLWYYCMYSVVCTSSFKGKVAPLKMLQKEPHFILMLLQSAGQ